MFTEFQNALSIGDFGSGIFYLIGELITWSMAILLLIGVVLITTRVDSNTLKVKKITYSGIAIAIATVLSLIEIFRMPQGGSVTLISMVFIALIGYFYGTAQGVICGFSYGLIQLALGGYVVHPVQLLLDYPIAFAALGLAGLFAKHRKGLVYGYLLGTLIRLMMHIISGVVFFAEYAVDANPFIYSTIYNGSYIGVEAVITLIILLIPAVEKALGIVKKNALAA